MTRYPCSGCGLYSCGGRCFSECPADYPDEPEKVAAPRAKYVPSEEYLAWCAEADSKRTTVVHGDPLRRVA